MMTMLIGAEAAVVIDGEEVEAPWAKFGTSLISGRPQPTTALALKFFECCSFIASLLIFRL
jgi:hypothetical protein